MPATFPSHAAAVLPLKIRWPAAFNGVALVVGSTTPDQAYAIYGRFHLSGTHQWPGLGWWCLPVALIETWLARRAAPIVAAHLPVAGTLALRDYGAIGRQRHHWYVTVYSALLGAITHLLWDGVSHRPDSPGWGRNLLPFLNTPEINRWWWWNYAELVWSIIGGIAAMLMFAWIGRHRLIRAWYGPAPQAPYLPWVFWTMVVACALAYPVTYPLLGYRHALHVQGIRILWAISLGLLTGAGAVATCTGLRQSWVRYRHAGRHRAGADDDTPVGSIAGAG